NEYNMFQLKEKGSPVEIVYPTEGVPLIVGPNGLMKDAPNPNAARLFQSYCFSPECQQLLIDVGGVRSLHPQTKEKPGRKPFAGIKKNKGGPGGVEKDPDPNKPHYPKVFPLLPRCSSPPSPSPRGPAPHPFYVPGASRGAAPDRAGDFFV